MTTLHAKLRLVTPAFIGDARQKPSSLRPPSIKGALRFWWRALAWPRAVAATSTEAEALRWLHEREAELFGVAAKGDAGGQGAFLLRAESPDRPPKISDWPAPRSSSAYLGLGLFPMKNYQDRSAIREGVEFELELTFRPGSTDDDREEIRQALRAWGLLGGLGSRARRGFGSVQLLEIDRQSADGDRDAYESDVGKLLAPAAKVDDPPFTAFSRNAQFKILAEGTTARDAHAELGRLFYQHRGQPSALRGAAKKAFGLPLAGLDTEHRRASPLFFHIHQVEDASPRRRYVAAALFLPATFHPEIKTGSLRTFYRDVASFLLAGAVPP